MILIRSDRLRQNTACPTSPIRNLRDKQLNLIFFILPFVTTLGLFLRSFDLDKQCLWMDEVYSVWDAAAFGNGGLTGLAAVDHIAPLHAILIWLVTLVSTPTESLVRMPSVISGAAAVPAFGWLVYEMFRNRTLAVVGSLLMCFSPYAIWYSQEARMYSLLLFFSVVFVALSWRVFERQLGPTLWISIASVSILGLYTHHFMALLILAFGIYLLRRLGLFNTRLWWWASAQALAVGFFLYWIYLTSEHLNAAAGTPKPMFALWIPYTLLSFSFGPTLGPSIAEIRELGIVSLLSYQGALVGAAALCGAYLIYRGLNEILKEETRQAGIWCAIWLIVPVFLAVLVTQLTNVSYNTRYVIVSLPALMIVLTVGVTSILRSGGAALGAVIALAALNGVALCNLYLNLAYAREDLRPVARMLSADLEPNDLLVLGNSRMLGVLHYYGARLPGQMLYVEPSGLPIAHNLDHTVAELKKVLEHPEINIWLIQYRAWEVDSNYTLQTILDKWGRVKEAHSWPGVSLRIYGPGAYATNHAQSSM
jgi:4-amino-4-deoxy-L-arabinose transferase-like glycosyltransferase